MAFRRGSVPEVVEENVTGFLVDTEKEMADVIRTKLDKFDREACRSAAIQRFSTSVMVDQYELLYQDVLRKWREEKSLSSNEPFLDEPSLAGSA